MRSLVFCLSLMSATASFAAPQNGSTPPLNATASYADLADFALASKIVAQVRVKSARPLRGELAAGTLPGRQRFLITAEIRSLIKAPEGLPQRIKYIVDAPLDSRGKPPRLNQTVSLIFALPARPGEVRLVAPDASLAWNSAEDGQVRRILAEATRRDAPPEVRGIASAFHSSGSLPGEGETQIFLETANNRPASLTVQRRSDAPPRWFVSLGEVVDEGVSQPAPESLLWYRLACFLPETLPDTALEGQAEADNAQVKLDYALIRQALGPCPRFRKP